VRGQASFLERAAAARWLRLTLVALALVAFVVSLWVSIARNLDLPWTSIRLAPAFALAHGLPLFSMPQQPPWVMVGYGPLYPVAYLPCVWTRHPTEAVVTATLLAHFYVLLPVGLLCSLLRNWPASSADGSSLTWAWALPLLLFALIAHLVPSLAYATTGVHADAPAFGLLLFACYAVMRGESATGRAARGWLVGAGVAAGLAAACKMNFAAGAVALFLWALRFSGWKRAAEFIGTTLLAAAATYLCDGLRDGFAPMLLNLGQPGRMPWFTFSDTETMALSGVTHEFPEKVRTFLTFARDYLKAYGAIALAVAVLIFARRRNEDASPVDRLVWFFLFLTLILAPVSIASISKYGGDVNSRALVSLPLTLAALFAMAAAAERGNLVAKAATYAALAGATFMIALPVKDDCERLWPKKTPTLVEAYAVLSGDPSRWYFPYDPLAHLLADGKFRPNMDVIYSYALIGLPVEESVFRSALPENLRYIALPPSGTEWGISELRRLLPEYLHPAPELNFQRHRVYSLGQGR
jgi:flagellar biosynthesis protein FliQ